MREKKKKKDTFGGGGVTNLASSFSQGKKKKNTFTLEDSKRNFCNSQMTVNIKLLYVLHFSLSCIPHSDDYEMHMDINTHGISALNFFFLHINTENYAKR